MCRLVLLCLVVTLTVATQQVPTKLEEDGFVSLIEGSELAEWEGARHAWKMENGLLVGRSDGSAPAVLTVTGREFEDFELRFEVRDYQGAVRVKMHGPAPGPMGVALEINSGAVEWFGNGSSVFVIASNRRNEWNEYRLVVRQNRFKVWQNGTPSALDLAVADYNAKRQTVSTSLRGPTIRRRSEANPHQGMSCYRTSAWSVRNNGGESNFMTVATMTIRR
jgi:hypothetical protein